LVWRFLIKIFQTNEIWLDKNFSAECKKNLEQSEKFLSIKQSSLLFGVFD
jgi:hypothetical protein